MTDWTLIGNAADGSGATPPPTSDGQVLGVVDGKAAWVDLPDPPAPPFAAPTTDGHVLVVVDGQATWVDPPYLLVE